MKNIKLSIVLLAMLLFTNSALAHVVVKPDKVGVGAFQTFTISVPSERETSTINIRLALPDGLESVTPTVKPGWKIEVKNHELPSGLHPYEIVWSGGSVPGHFRDDFSFSAKVPATPMTLAWKAYQTYSDGSVVSWDLVDSTEQPKKEDGSPDFSKIGPASKTLIVDDLSASSAGSFDDISTSVSVAAILVAIAALVVSSRKRK